MATLASGKIQASTNLKGIPEQVILFTAEQNTTLSFMQFVSENDTDIDIRISLVLFTGETRLIPKATDLKTTNLLQFDVEYPLIMGEYVFATTNQTDVINFLIKGETS
jgi:hypothetical protein